MAPDIHPKMIFIVALIAAIFQSANAQEISSKTWRDTATNTLETIFEYYDKRVRPDIKTTIALASAAMQNVQFDEQSGVLDIYIHWSMFWKDERLSWDLTLNDTLPHLLHISSSMIWLPDLYLTNSPSVDDAWNDKKYPITISPEGEVSWTAPLNARVICKSNFTLWPHDTHTCKFKLYSFTHDGYAVDLVPPENSIFETNGENLDLKTVGHDEHISASQWLILPWKMKKNEKFYECCPEPFPDIEFGFSVLRNAPGFAASIQIPTFCLSILSVVMFLLPVNAAMKVGFGGFCLVINVILLVFLCSLIPQTSELPLIVQLLSVQLQLIMTSIIVSALILRLASYPRWWPFPSCFQVVLRMVALFLCLQSYAEDVMTVDDADDPINLHNLLNDPSNSEGPSNPPRKSVLRRQYGWVVIAAAIDRLSFFVFLFVCIGTVSQYKMVLFAID